MLVLDLKQAYIHEFLKAEEAARVDLPDEVQHISLLSGLLPDALPDRYHSLLSHCDFSLHLELAGLDEVERVAVGLTDVVDWLIGKEPLRVEDAVHILH